MYIYMHIHIYLYLYVYLDIYKKERKKERKKGFDTPSPPQVWWIYRLSALVLVSCLN